MPHSSVARRYARFTLGLALDDVPAPVVDKAKQLVLDIIGSCLASSQEEFGRAVLRATESLGGLPESTLIGAAARVGASHAVLANGTLAHGLDFDDTREDAIVHTGSVAVTTALAVGEATGASGRAVLEAAIAGVEVMCRVGLAVPGRFHARHYHPTSLAGSFAAAAVAGRLRGLTEDQLVSAFGICGSQAGGIIEYLTDGSWTKRLHPGWAAHAGVVATLFVETALLTVGGAALGVVLAVSTVRLFRNLSPIEMPRLQEIHADWRVLLFAFAVAATTMIAAGLLPALVVLRVDPQAALQQNGGRASTERSSSAVRCATDAYRRISSAKFPHAR